MELRFTGFEEAKAKLQSMIDTLIKDMNPQNAFDMFAQDLTAETELAAHGRCAETATRANTLEAKV